MNDKIIPDSKASAVRDGSKAMDTRVAYTPSEFAALFGRSQTWGYRQLYAGKVRAITGCGRILIPRGEVDRLVSEASAYDGAKKTGASWTIQSQGGEL